MKTKPLAIVLMILCTFFTSTAQLLYKSGANKLEFNLMSIISNWNIFLGLFLYGIGAILLIVALKWGQVTILYPILASSFIWVTLGSSYFFGEIISLSRWIGVLFIIIGILMINFSEKREGISGFTEAV